MNQAKLTPQQFQEIYPYLIDWIQKLLASHAAQARSVASVGFARLPLYFSQALLVSSKFVPVARLPMPPLSALGLTQFAEFEKAEFEGITYLDTFFLKQPSANNERQHFHELIHIVQWRILGPERFLAAYADGLESFGYHHSPLEVMAYAAEESFCKQAQVFDAEQLVAEQLKLWSDSK